jgi:hypothetical protein
LPSDEWATRRDPLLDRVYARGQELRRRRQMALGFVAVALLILIAVPAAALTGSGSSHRKVNTIGSPTTSSETVPETVAVPETTTTEPPTTTVAPTTTTTALVCRNSYNPKCGPFRYDPPPVSHPITVSISFSPPNPTTGEKVAIHVVADSPDAGVGNYNVTWGDSRPPIGGARIVDPLCDGTPARPRYGPWDPPPRHPGHEEFDFDATYDKAGSYPVSFSIQSSPTCGEDDVYHSQGEANATLTVTGPPVSTTSTTAPH